MGARRGDVMGRVSFQWVSHPSYRIVSIVGDDVEDAVEVAVACMIAEDHT